jgi:hypothetical protein
MTVNRGEIMKNLFSGIGRAKAFRFTALAALGLGVSACTYDGGVGIGYASGGGYSGYQCDPYSPFDNYYDCDNGYGFSNMGYGGGWYNGFYYPGYGTYLFDNYGQRYGMQNDYRRYWGQRRYDWNRGHQQGNRHDNRGYQGGERDGRHQDYQPQNQYRGPDNSGTPHRQYGGRMDGREGAGPDRAIQREQPYIRQGHERGNYSPPAQQSGAVPEQTRQMERAPQRSAESAAGGHTEQAAPSWGGQSRGEQASGRYRGMEELRQRRNQR